jgi:hypothetical protein
VPSPEASTRPNPPPAACPGARRTGRSLLTGDCRAQPWLLCSRQPTNRTGRPLCAGY